MRIWPILFVAALPSLGFAGNEFDVLQKYVGQWAQTSPAYRAKVSVSEVAVGRYSIKLNIAYFSNGVKQTFNDELFLGHFKKTAFLELIQEPLGISLYFEKETKRDLLFLKEATGDKLVFYKLHSPLKTTGSKYKVTYVQLGFKENFLKVEIKTQSCSILQTPDGDLEMCGSIGQEGYPDSLVLSPDKPY